MNKIQPSGVSGKIHKIPVMKFPRVEIAPVIAKPVPRVAPVIGRPMIMSVQWEDLININKSITEFLKTKMR